MTRFGYFLSTLPSIVLVYFAGVLQMSVPKRWPLFPVNLASFCHPAPLWLGSHYTYVRLHRTPGQSMFADSANTCSGHYLEYRLAAQHKASLCRIPVADRCYCELFEGFSHLHSPTERQLPFLELQITWYSLFWDREDQWRLHTAVLPSSLLTTTGALMT